MTWTPGVSVVPQAHHGRPVFERTFFGGSMARGSLCGIDIWTGFTESCLSSFLIDLRNCSGRQHRRAHGVGLLPRVMMPYLHLGSLPLFGLRGRSCVGLGGSRMQRVERVRVR